MKCPKCQAEILDDSQFCSKCGTPIQSPEHAFFSQTRTILRPIEELPLGNSGGIQSPEVVRNGPYPPKKRIHQRYPGLARPLFRPCE
jgi:hypothetical protein